MRLVCVQNYFVAEIFYHLSGTLVKCSIALSLIRVCKTKSVHWALYAIVGLTCLGCAVYIAGLLKICTPVSAMWNAGTGSCDHGIQLGISYLHATTYIVVDGTLAALPFCVFRGAKIDSKTRCCVAIVLASAAL